MTDPASSIPGAPAEARDDAPEESGRGEPAAGDALAPAGAPRRSDLLWVQAEGEAAAASEILAPFGIRVVPVPSAFAARAVLDVAASRYVGLVVGPGVPWKDRDPLVQAARARQPSLPVGSLAWQGGDREVETLVLSFRSISAGGTASPADVLEAALRHYARRWRRKLLGYGSRDTTSDDVLAAYMRDCRRAVRDGALSVPADPAVAREVRALIEPEAPALGPALARLGDDPVLSGRLVALANSTAYGGRTQVTSPSPAAVRVGLAGLRALFSPGDLGTSPEDGPVAAALAAERARGNRVSRLARLIAGEGQPEGTSDPAAFAGLLLRSGRLASRVALGDDRVPPAARGSLLDPAAVERHVASSEQGFTFALLSRWDLAATFERTLLAQKNPTARVPLSPAALCAVRADLLVQAREAGLVTVEDADPGWRERFEALGLLAVPKARLQRWWEETGAEPAPPAAGPVPAQRVEDAA